MADGIGVSSYFVARHKTQQAILEIDNSAVTYHVTRQGEPTQDFTADYRNHLCHVATLLDEITAKVDRRSGPRRSMIPPIEVNIHTDELSQNTEAE